MPPYFARRYDEAIARLTGIVEWNPGFANAHANLGLAYIQKRMYKEAIDEFSKARQHGGLGLASAHLGYAYAAAGRRADAQAIVDELSADPTRAMPYYFAIVNAGLGNKDEAIRWLREAYDKRDVYIVQLKVDPLFDGLRSDPRFIDLLRSLRLADELPRP
jgi:tetratricopeptide (TPR) repeat protein